MKNKTTELEREWQIQSAARKRVEQRLANQLFQRLITSQLFDKTKLDQLYAVEFEIVKLTQKKYELTAQVADQLMPPLD